MNTIQERMRNKAIEALGQVEGVLDDLMEQKKTSFSMYKYLKQLGYSSRVVNYMKGHFDHTIFEIKNEEKCEQLENEKDNFQPKHKRTESSKPLKVLNLTLTNTSMNINLFVR